MNKRTEESILEEALEFPNKEAREAILHKACGGDAALRQRVEALLGATERAGGFLSLDETEMATIGETIASAPSEGPGTTIGRYKLLAQIGEGGCGVVYMAEQREPVVRKVALKVIKLGMDTKQVIARFEAERQALALMDHPNIAKVLDGGTTDTGRPYFVMELVRGIPMTQFCDENVLNTKERLQLFIDVCAAIQHAHQKGIIHRDIKPSNVLVTMNDDQPMPKVIDFGIAKAIDQKLTEKTLFTHINQFMGTPAYMSPEQAQPSAIDIDTRSDIYSLGVLLYELLTGKTPFDAKKLMSEGLDEIRRHIREVEPLIPSTRLSGLTDQEIKLAAKHRKSDPAKLGGLIRGELDWMVMKALEKDRKRRYETANAFAQDIKAYLNDEPVSAVAPSFSYRFRKFARRHRVTLATSCAFALVLILGTAISIWQAVRANRNAATAVRNEALANRNAIEARQNALEAERESYFSEMNLAQSDWENSEMGRLRRSLERSRTSSERGFEWNYWQRLAHLDELTLRGHAAELRSVAFSPDGRHLVSASADRTAKVWAWAKNGGKQEPILVLDGHSDLVTSAIFSPDGHHLLTTSRDKTAKVWDAETGKELLSFAEHRGNVFSAAFSSDGRRAVTGSQDRTSRVWEIATGKELLVLSNGMATVRSVAFSPDDRLVATSGVGKRDQVRLWDARTGTLISVLTGHTRGVWSVCFSPDGRTLVTASDDGTAKVWEVRSASPLFELQGGHRGGIQSAAFSRDGQRIVTGSDDQTAKVWDAKTGSLLYVLKGHESSVCSVAFSPDGGYVATASWDKTVKLWKGKSEPYTGLLDRHTNGVLSAVFSNDGSRIVTTGRDGTAIIWKSNTGRFERILHAHTAAVLAASFSPDGGRVVTGSEDKSAIVWDVGTGTPVATFTNHNSQVDGSIWSAAFSPDGQRIATGAYGGAAVLILTFQPLRLGIDGRIKPVSRPVGRVADVPDGGSVRWLARCRRVRAEFWRRES